MAVIRISQINARPSTNYRAKIVTLLRFQLLNPACRTLCKCSRKKNCTIQQSTFPPIKETMPAQTQCCKISVISRWENVSTYKEKDSPFLFYWWALRFDSKSANLSLIWCEERKISIPCSAGEIACVAKITAEWVRESIRDGWVYGEKPAAHKHTQVVEFITHAHQDSVGS